MTENIDLGNCWQCESFDRKDPDANERRLKRFAEKDFYAPPRREGECKEAKKENLILSRGNPGRITTRDFAHRVSSQNACDVQVPDGDWAYTLHPLIKRSQK